LIEDFEALKTFKFLKEQTSCCFFCKKNILANQDTLKKFEKLGVSFKKHNKVKTQKQTLKVPINDERTTISF
jgi:hypothetical protein